VLKRVFL